MAVCILAILFLNRSLFSSGYTVDARFTNAAGISKGTEVMVAGVNVGSVTSVQVHGNAVDATLSVNNSVQLPARHDGGGRGRDAARRRRRDARTR